jgi:hypothetical protein
LLASAVGLALVGRVLTAATCAVVAVAAAVLVRIFADPDCTTPLSDTRHSDAAVTAAALDVELSTDWLQIFRTEQIASVNVTQTDLVELPDLSAYGEIEVTKRPTYARSPTPPPPRRRPPVFPSRG